MAPLIEAGSLSKSYLKAGRSIAVLRGLDLRVEPGEFVSIMGSSGSGKSTLLHILGCLERPSSGSYRLAGRDMDTLDDAGLSQIRANEVGFVFQKFHLLPQLSVMENVALPFFYSSKAAGADAGRRALEVMAQVGLAHRALHRPSELSGGETQRAAIARALVGRPRLVLADEPTGSLDAATGRDRLALFEGIHRAGATVVLVTHDPSVAARAGRTLVLKEGRFD